MSNLTPPPLAQEPTPDPIPVPVYYYAPGLTAGEIAATYIERHGHPPPTCQVVLTRSGSVAYAGPVPPSSPPTQRAN